MMPDSLAVVDCATLSPPPHLAEWTLPPGWAWGREAILRETRHYQEVVDALGRSLSLVSTPEPEHAEWLTREARALAHRNHPSIPTTYHYWASYEESRRGPGYLRRWITGETVRSRITRLGPEAVPLCMQVLREAGSTLAYLHDTGRAHGTVSPQTVWLTPGGRLWMLGWEWVLPTEQLPAGYRPDLAVMANPPEWADGRWRPTPASDQWQLAAMLFTMLTGETPPEQDAPPLSLLRPDCPQSLARVVDRGLRADLEARYPSIGAMVRDLDRHGPARQVFIAPDGHEMPAGFESPEAQLRWATGDDYEILAPLGRGKFGSVWRARDLSLAREVAIKMLHPHIATDDAAVSRFRREARLAAQLAHPAIVPIYDTDSRADIAWYTMELAEGGSVSSLIARGGPLPFEEIAQAVDDVLEALSTAHASGVIHRDLKPENILIDRYRHWRIGDFGIAYALGEERAGTSGTPSFAAPEQLLGEAQGPMTDCYALAAIVFFVLTGKTPFGEGRAETILAHQLSDDLPSHLASEGLPDALVSWLVRGLAPAVEDRFADAEEMRAAWRQVVRAVRQAEDMRPWWRRLITGTSDDAADAPSAHW